MSIARMSLNKLSKSGDLNILRNGYQGFKDMSLGQKINVAGTGAAGVMGYSDARDEGHGVVGSLARGATDAFLIDLIGMKKYIAGSILMSAPSMIAKGYESVNSRAREMERAGTASPFANNSFEDNQQIYTMRQAGMSMMESSSYNTKTAVLGNEAQFMHR